MRAVLRDDLRAPGVDPVLRVRAGLSDDPPPVVDSEVLPVLTVRARRRTGYDEDGSPVFEWSVVVSGPAVVWEQRTEVDDVAGVTSAVASATVLYDGDVQVTEASTVDSSQDGRWSVSGVTQFADRLELQLVRQEP